MTTLLGIDCAMQPVKPGLALGILRDGKARIQECAVGSKSWPPVAIASDWLLHHDEVLIAFDAPFGWPRPSSASD